MNKIDRKIVLTPEECSFVQIYYDCKTIKSLFYAIFVALGEIYGREKIHNGRTFGRRRSKT